MRRSIIREESHTLKFKREIFSGPGWNRRLDKLPENYETHPVEICFVLTGEKGAVYYAGSGLDTEPIFKILKTEGSEGVWKALEKYYHEIDEIHHAAHREGA